VPKKRKPPHRKGLSGNPRRRAAQLGPPIDDRAGTVELARKMADSPRPAPWWAQSHRRVLARTRSLAWPSDPGGIEELTCQVVGDELYDQLRAKVTGLHLSAWLRDLITATGTVARSAGTADRSALWALQRGLALITPSEPPGNYFFDIEDPLEVARAEAAATAGMLGETWLLGAEPAGEPLLARDVYGSRFLLTAPFAYAADGMVDHWYAWDVDTCWLGMTLNAGPFSSHEAALKEWRDAVGPAAADAVFTPCPQDLMTSLLPTEPMSNTFDGAEPLPVAREYYRMRRRAHAIATPPDGDAVKIVDPDGLVNEFGRWYRSRHGDFPSVVRASADLIADQWGPVRSVPDDRVSRGCSPHRIRQTATLIRDARLAEGTNAALKLLPEWTQWCIDSTGLTGEPAERALQAAVAGSSDDEGPFRVRE
jgi:hypothetical protein